MCNPVNIPVVDLADNPGESEAFADRLVEILNHGAIALMTSIGHRTGLFDTLAELPPALYSDGRLGGIKKAEENLGLVGGDAPQHGRAHLRAIGEQGGLQGLVVLGGQLVALDRQILSDSLQRQLL